jgi:hypothetical protein
MTRSPLDAATSRRQALRLGGVTLGLGAIVAACGDDRGGDESAGRVGYAPPVTDLGDYAVTDAVLLRTASSLELTAVEVYGAVIELGALSGEAQQLAESLHDSHQAVADAFGELTVAAGGEAWECTNPWLMERSIEPILAVIAESDDVARDVFALAISIEDLTAATHQAFTVQLSESDQRLASAEAAALESRQSAALAIANGGAEAYVSPAVFGAPVEQPGGVIPQYAITSQFGFIGQIQLLVGVPDDNGNRQSFLLQTPADNSYIYEETEPTC